MLPLILQVNSNSKSGSEKASDQGSYSRGLMAGLTVAMVLVILNIIGLLVYHRRRYAKYLNPFHVHYTSKQPFGQSNIVWLNLDLEWSQTKRGFKPCWMWAGAHQIKLPSPLTFWVNPFPSRVINRTIFFCNALESHECTCCRLSFLYFHWLFPLLACETSSGSRSIYKPTRERVDSKGLCGRWRLPDGLLMWDVKEPTYYSKRVGRDVFRCCGCPLCCFFWIGASHRDKLMHLSPWTEMYKKNGYAMHCILICNP